MTSDTTRKITRCPRCGSEQIFAAPQQGGRPDSQGQVEFHCRCAACGHRWTHTGTATKL